jgi:hypothetical protein
MKLRATVPLKLPMGNTTIVDVPGLPGLTLTTVGIAERVKSGGEVARTVTFTTSLRMIVPRVAVTCVV